MANAWEDWLAEIASYAQQQVVALQLDWQLDPTLNQRRDRLLAALTHPPDEQRQLVQALLVEATPTPQQLTVILQRLLPASERAYAAALIYELACTQPETLGHYRAVAAQAYGESGWPLVLAPPSRSQSPESPVEKKEDQTIATAASATLLTAVVAIALSQAATSGFLQVAGPGSLERLRREAEALRQETLTGTQAALAPNPQPTDAQTSEWPWEQWLRPLTTFPSDPPLALAYLGIQGTQITEFLARQLRGILRSDWLRFVVPLPFHLVLDALQLLTSDLILGVGNAVEDSLDATSATRRLTLVLQALSRADRIPAPGVLRAATQDVVVAADDQLAPLLAQQLTALADGFDPQLRNPWLNDVGRQLNQWSPVQAIQGWLNQLWIENWQALVQDLVVLYPSLRSLQIYQQGIQAASGEPRLMDQAIALRTTAARLNQVAPPSKTGTIQVK